MKKIDDPHVCVNSPTTTDDPRQLLADIIDDHFDWLHRPEHRAMLMRMAARLATNHGKVGPGRA
jgi:hypothetical protein